MVQYVKYTKKFKPKVKGYITQVKHTYVIYFQMETKRVCKYPG